MHDGTGEEFVSEAIEPVAGSFDASAMARGEAGVPRAFAWRGTSYVVAQVLGAWKSSSADRGEMYLRRHWYRVETESGERMTLYCERQARSAKRAKKRWWLYSVGRADR
ncbi:MAG TPA: DUF6504 family protein [Tepidisphaeraceae bacterium]|jgi:hypothetical protein